MKVSVIVPIYNMEQYLMPCVKSLLEQSFEDKEILLVNDGSRDRSLEICNELSQEHPDTVRVINKSNGGLSSARNAGIEAATGEYVCFVDPDDFVETIFLEKMYNTIINSGSDVVACGICVEYVNRNYTITEQVQNEQYYDAKDIGQAVLQLDDSGIFNYAWNKMYKKSVLNDNNITFDLDGVPGEDLLFNCKVFKNITGVALIKECLYHYMRRDVVTLVNTYKSNLYEKVKKFNEERRKLYEYLGIDSEFGRTCYARHYCEYILPCIFNLYRQNSDMTFERRTKEIRNINNDKYFCAYMKIYKPRNLLYRFYLNICKIKSPLLQNIIFSFLFSFRYRFRNTYYQIREKLGKNN